MGRRALTPGPRRHPKAPAKRRAAGAPPPLPPRGHENVRPRPRGAAGFPATAEPVRRAWSPSRRPGTSGASSRLRGREREGGNGRRSPPLPPPPPRDPWLPPVPPLGASPTPTVLGASDAPTTPTGDSRARKSAPRGQESQPVGHPFEPRGGEPLLPYGPREAGERRESAAPERRPQGPELQTLPCSRSTRHFSFSGTTFASRPMSPGLVGALRRWGVLMGFLSDSRQCQRCLVRRASIETRRAIGR